MPLVPLLAEMEMNGVLLDRALLMEMSAGLGTDMLRLEKEIYNCRRAPVQYQLTAAAIRRPFQRIEA